MKNLILVTTALFIVSCSNPKTVQAERIGASRVEQSNQKIPLEKRIKNCICPQIYMPVCGEDNKTYSNSCVAECAGVKFTMGACEKDAQE